jgi:hypothetical protein
MLDEPQDIADLEAEIESFARKLMVATPEHS